MTQEVTPRKGLGSGAITAIVGFPLLIAGAIGFVMWESGADDRKAISGGKASVANMMKDPASAEFRNLRLYNRNLCGEVNAKNSYGAYSGFEKFQSSYSVATLESEYVSRVNLAISIGQSKSIADSTLAFTNWQKDFETCQRLGKPVDVKK